MFNKLVKYDIPKGIQHRSRGTPIKAPTRNLGLNLVVKKALNATYRQFHNLGDVYIRSKHVMRENTPRIDALLLDF